MQKILTLELPITQWYKKQSLILDMHKQRLHNKIGSKLKI